VIYQKCDACGEKSMVDMQHKLTTFILNSHKKAEKAAGGSKKDRKEKREKESKVGGCVGLFSSCVVLCGMGWVWGAIRPSKRSIDRCVASPPRGY
jgi:hypothetical protein